MGLPALVADYLFIGPLIAARLAAEIADLPVEHVETAEQLNQADQRRRTAKVMWAGDTFEPGENGRAREGSSQIVHQRWLVALVMNHEGQKADARHTAAGPTLSAIHRALAGWQPAGAARALRRAQAPLRPSLTPTSAVYPLGFEITLAL